MRYLTLAILISVGSAQVMDSDGSQISDSSSISEEKEQEPEFSYLGAGFRVLPAVLMWHSALSAQTDAFTWWAGAIGRWNLATISLSELNKTDQYLEGGQEKPILLGIVGRLAKVGMLTMVTYKYYTERSLFTRVTGAVVGTWLTKDRVYGPHPVLVTYPVKLEPISQYYRVGKYAFFVSLLAHSAMSKDKDLWSDMAMYYGGTLLMTNFVEAMYDVQMWLFEDQPSLSKGFVQVAKVGILFATWMKYDDQPWRRAINLVLAFQVAKKGVHALFKNAN